MLSNKAKYALHATFYLARHYGEGPILISEMAEKERIPKKFLEVILLELKNQGLLISRKGKGGGYLLRKPPKDITVGQIIRIIDGPLAPVPCVSVTAYESCDECRDESTCGIRIVMKEVRDAIANILDKTSIEDVLNRVDSTVSGSYMYYI